MHAFQQIQMRIQIQIFNDKIIVSFTAETNSIIFLTKLQ